MATFQMSSMRAALPSVRPRATVSAKQSVVLPAFTGMRSTALPMRTASVSLVAPSNGIKVSAMRHGYKKAHLNKPADQRKALIRALVTEVIRHGKIRTTRVRAKAIRPFVDKMITLSKDGSLHARRQAMGFIYDKDLVTALFEEGPKRYAERNGGYCRVKKEVRNRRGDNAEMATIELV